MEGAKEFNIFKSVGKLRYNPSPLGSSGKKWWCVVDCDPNIGKYYRHLYFNHTYKLHRLRRPAWKEHITVVRNELPNNPESWGMFDGEPVEFHYTGETKDNGRYFWITVNCPWLLDLREKLGLNREPFFPLHMSIGHIDSKESFDE